MTQEEFKSKNPPPKKELGAVWYIAGAIFLMGIMPVIALIVTARGG